MDLSKLGPSQVPCHVSTASMPMHSQVRQTYYLNISYLFVKWTTVCLILFYVILYVYNMYITWSICFFWGNQLQVIWWRHIGGGSLIDSVAFLHAETAKVRLGELAAFSLRVIPVAAGGFCGTCPTRSHSKSQTMAVLFVTGHQVVPPCHLRSCKDCPGLWCPPCFQRKATNSWGSALTAADFSRNVDVGFTSFAIPDVSPDEDPT